ncbi:transmembrane protease serine 3-like [Rhinoraja longicauda]
MSSPKNFYGSYLPEHVQPSVNGNTQQWFPPPLYPSMPQDAPQYTSSGQYPAAPYPGIGNAPHQPYYIPTPGPTHPPTQVTQSIGRFWMFPKSTQCCDPKRRTYCYIISLFLGLSIVGIGAWIVIRFIMDSPTQMISHCPGTPTRCNGISECEDNSDELGCVRFKGRQSQLEVYGWERNQWSPVCYTAWSPNLAIKTCQQLGFTSYYRTKSMIGDTSSALVINAAQKLTNLQSILSYSSQCPAKDVVSLQCVDCGKRSKTSSRIVGGTQSQVGDWPWQVSLHHKNQPVCGGTIISRDWVITATHCIFDDEARKPSNWKVYSGFISQRRLSQATLSFISKIIVHKGYNADSNDNDIALLKLSNPLRFTGNIMPACLPTINQQFPNGSRCWITGFGRMHEDANSASNSLLEAPVNIISRTTCNQRRIYNGRITENMICAGKLTGGIDSCQGDSGGPLVCKADGIYYLAGITSWGIGCARVYKPGVYTNMLKYTQWTYAQMESNK